MCTCLVCTDLVITLHRHTVGVFFQLKFHGSGKLKRMVVTQGNHRADAVPQ